MEYDDLQHGIAAFKAGDIQKAQSLFAGIVRRNPKSEPGWLWLGHCLSDPQKREYCYQKVLALNPQNEDARKAFMGVPTNNQIALKDAPVGQLLVQPESKVSSGVDPINKPTFKTDLRDWLLVLLLAVFVFLCVLPFTYLELTGKFTSIAANLRPSIQTTQHPLATETSHITPSSLSLTMITPSLSPSPTPTSPIPSQSSTPTVNSFKPGDPTATPLGSDITDPNYLAGLKAMKEKDHDEVIRLMSIVIDSNPDLAPPYVERGQAYWYLDMCEEGLADIEQALSLNPAFASAWAVHGLLMDCLGDIDHAWDDYRKALSLDPSLASVHHNLGVDYYNLGDYERSLDEYSMAAAIDPTEANAWDGMSEALMMLGRNDECIKAATKALETDPELWLAYADRGLCHLNQGEYAEAVEDYKIYIAQPEASAGSWYNYGLGLDRLGDFNGAVSAYTKALLMDAALYEAHINRGMVYLELREYNNALKDFNDALLSGDIPLAYTGRGNAYLNLRQYTKAISDLEKSIDMYPYDPWAYCTIAQAYLEVARYQDALEAARTSLQLGVSPACQGKVMEVQARSYYALEDYDQALLYMDKSLQAQPNMLGYYYRGIIYQAAGRKEEAIQDLETFLVYAQQKNYKGPEVADAKSRLSKLKS